MKITSSQNEKIKLINNLLKKSKWRRIQKLFVIDGSREIKEALKAGIELKEFFYCPELSRGEAIKVAVKKTNLVSQTIFRKLSYKEKPDGALAVFIQKQLSLKDIKLSKNPLIIVLENIEKPGNIGAIIRTAYAAGVDLIIINDSQTDIYNPNIIRASEGKLFNVPLIILSRNETAIWLKKNKIISLAAVTKAKQDYFSFKLNRPLAIVLGSENQGLSTAWQEQVDEKIKIPMQTGADSLNVSVATAIILFEALRQRKFD